MTHERIPVEGWQDQRGHVERYEWVRQFLPEREDVADFGCGIGYGAAVLRGHYHEYLGIDLAPPAPEFFLPGTVWRCTDLNEPHYVFTAIGEYPTVIAFEVLEHVKDPADVARKLEWTAGYSRGDFENAQIFVSVPVVPTKHMNEHHLHDFTVDDIPPMFPGWRVADEWAQPREMSHVWRFVRE